MPRALVLFAAVLFGTTGTAQALGPDASPLAVGAARIAVGGALLVALDRFLAARERSRGDGTAWSRRWVTIAAAGIVAYQLSFFAAVDDTGVAVGTVVALGSAPALTGLLARAVDGAALTRRWAMCTALATTGVLLLVLGGGDASVSPLGIGLALIAGASYGLYTLASKQLITAGHAPESVMARGFGFAAVALLPVLFITGGDGLASAGGLGLAVYLGAVPTAIAYVLFARGLRSLGAGETATLTLAEPLTAALLGAVVLGERPGAVAVTGAVLVLAGLVALAMPERSRRAAPLRVAEVQA